MKRKARLDAIIHERMPQYSRRQIQSWIMQGRVAVDGSVITKSGHITTQMAVIDVDTNEPRYVSRAGYKLEHAITTFGLSINGLVVLDAGLSTGGFADCLLQHGALRVYGVDVGYGQVHEKIRHDPRVIVMERTNLRELRNIKELVDCITLDLSFISLLKVMDAVDSLLKETGMLITLIKPQFEAQRHAVGRGGIVRDAAVHDAVIKRVTAGFQDRGYTVHAVIPSPIEGATGNKEFIAYSTKKIVAI